MIKPAGGVCVARIPVPCWISSRAVLAFMKLCGQLWFKLKNLLLQSINKMTNQDVLGD